MPSRELENALVMQAKPGELRRKIPQKAPSRAETLHDALENPIFGNPIDENTV
jgi:hypothetical protein